MLSLFQKIIDFIRKMEFQMSLRRGIKTFGFKGFVQMGAAAATGYLSILGYLYKS